MKIKYLFMFLIIVLAGCASNPAFNVAEIANEKAQQEGSPFRWKVKSFNGGTLMYQEMIPLPTGPSKADSVLKADTFELLRKAEDANGRSEVTLEEIKHLPDGREVWVLKSKESGIAYIVKYKPSEQGGTDIEIKGPILYDK